MSLKLFLSFLGLLQYSILYITSCTYYVNCWYKTRFTYVALLDIYKKRISIILIVCSNNLQPAQFEQTHHDLNDHWKKMAFRTGSCHEKRWNETLTPAASWNTATTMVTCMERTWTLYALLSRRVSLPTLSFQLRSSDICCTLFRIIFEHYILFCVLFITFSRFKIHKYHM